MFDAHTYATPLIAGTQDADRSARLKKLKAKAADLCGGDMIEGPCAADADPAVIEAFWAHVVAFETAPHTTHFAQLEDAGMALPSPGALGDTEIHSKLWEVIRALAGLGVFLERTDHLSDRALYSLLWTDLLRHDTTVMPPQFPCNAHLDILGGCSEADIQTSLRYYEDDDEREYWRTSFPDLEIPDHEDLPYDRDRSLPKPEYAQ